MTTSYLPYTPGQQMLLPAALQEWLPEGHLAYFISDTIDSLELSAFHARYAQGGSAQPAVSSGDDGQGVGVWLRDRSVLLAQAGAQAARGCGVSSAGGRQLPGASDDLRLRALHLEELSGLFVQVVKLARECGLVKLGTIAVDGTKIKANASRHKAMSYERMQKAEAELTATDRRSVGTCACGG